MALKNIEILERERLVERTRSDSGPHLARALGTLADHPLVGEVRTRGLLGAVEIVADRSAGRRVGGKEGHAGPLVRDLCIKGGLMVRAVRDTIVMSPPLVITDDEIDRIPKIIRQALDEAERPLREHDTAELARHTAEPTAMS